MPPGTLRAISMGWVGTMGRSGPRLCSQCFWLSGEPCGARSRDPSGARPRRPQRPSGAFHPLPGIGARRASIAARQWSQGRGVMERIRRGFQLLKGSWDVLRSDKELLLGAPYVVFPRSAPLRLAHLDQVAVGVADVAADLPAAVLRGGEEL